MKEAFWLKNKISGVGELINLKMKVYQYFNQKGDKIKELSKPIEKIFIKEITQKEYESKFKSNAILDFTKFTLLVYFIPLAYIFNLPIPSSFFKKNPKLDEKKIVEELLIDENF